jgi:apolipoprotein N-acyltransferase
MLERMTASSVPAKLVPALLLFLALLFSCTSLLVQELWPSSLIGLSLFLYLLWRHTKNALSAGIYGLIFGTGTGGASILWLFDTLPLTTHGITNPILGFLLVYSAFSITAFCFGLATSIGSIAIFHIRNSAFAGLLVALLWFITEELRMGAFALLTTGLQTPLELHFSLSALAYPLTESSFLLQLADPFGIRGLSFALALIAGTLALLPGFLKNRTRTLFPLIASTLLLSLPLIHPYTPPSSTHTVRVALITSRVSHGESHESLRPLFEEASRDPLVDLIVFPENITPRSIYPSDIPDLLHTKAMLIYSEETAHAMRITFEARNGNVQTQDKQFLVPFGEYLPVVGGRIGTFFPVPIVTRAIQDAMTAVIPGESFAVLEDDGVRIGALLCSEILSPSLYKDLVHATDADLLVNLSSRSWFHESRLLDAKILQAGKIQAVMNRKPFLLAGNNAPSFALSSFGSVIASTTPGEERVLWVDVSF